MLSLEEAQNRAETLVAAARKAGADAADAVYGCDASSSVSVRLGALEDVERSESEHVSLRVFVGRRSASISSSDMAAATLASLVDRAIAMAKEAPEDAWSGLAPEDRLLRGHPANVDIVDDADPEPTLLRERALEAEEAARGVSGITNSEGAGAGHGRSQVALVTSHGFAAAYAGTSHSTWASVLAGTGDAMQRDYASHSARYLDDLDTADAIGLRAGHRTVARLNPRRVESGPMPIIFDPRVGNSLVGHLIGAIVGPAITRRSSFLLDSLGKAIFPEGITILDDPRRPRGMRSRPFDGEGLPTAERALIDKGVLTGWLLDSASARQLGLEPTGHAVRGGGSPGASATNVHLVPGELGPLDLMRDIKHGLYITELIGQGVNGVTGDYSRGAAGFLIENGTVECAVSEITIASNLKEMFANIVAANDLDFRYAVNVPTLRVDGMTVAGA
ncbi:MAG TPA: metallopeptidase TldD-related protein [Sphingobium sp.]|uniref:TldD/PmbA family protein n=1 Tax=Sphingobium sp. TaxID=1912891 RepID=UPI002ED31730